VVQNQDVYSHGKYDTKYRILASIMIEIEEIFHAKAQSSRKPQRREKYSLCALA
jgi:hypothetical protein